MNWTFLYVAIIYFGAVAAARRTAHPVPWRIAIFFYLLVLVFLFAPLTQSVVNLPADFLPNFYPWMDDWKIPRVQNSEINDLILQIVPWAHLARDSWRAGEFPLWNPSATGGYPLLANGQSAALSGLRLLALPLDIGYSFAFEGALKLLIALTFAWLFMRRRGSSELASLITAVSFAFSTAVIVWLHFPLGSVTVFLPVVFYAIDLLFERTSYPRFLLLAAAFWQMLLHGHPETAAHIVFFSAVYVLFRLASGWSRGRLRAALVMAGAGLVALVLALPFILPFLEALPFTHRYNMLREFPEFLGTPTDARFLVPFYQPMFYGNVTRGTAWGPANAEAIAGYCGILAVAAWFAMLFHQIRRREWKQDATLFVFAVPLLLAITLEWPVISDLFRSIPPFEIAANARLRFVLCWCLAILAGMAVDLARGGNRLPLVLGFVLTGTLLGITFPLNGVVEKNVLGRTLMTSLPAFVALAAAFWATIRGMKNVLSTMMLLVFVAVDLWSFGHTWNPVVPREKLFPIVPMVEFLAVLPQDPEVPHPHRIAGTRATFFPNSAAMFGHEDIRGHDPMANGKVLGMMRVLLGYTSGEYFGILEKVDHPFLDFLNVGYVMTTTQEDLDDEQFELIYHNIDGRVWRNRETVPRFFPAERIVVQPNDERRYAAILQHEEWGRGVFVETLPRHLLEPAREELFATPPADAPEPTVKVVDIDAQRIVLDIDAPRWTLVAGSQPYFPGWRIEREIEGRRDELEPVIVNEAFIGFLVPRGQHRVVLRYRPLSFYAGLGLSLFTIFLLAIAPLVVRRIRR